MGCWPFFPWPAEDGNQAATTLRRDDDGFWEENRRFFRDALSDKQLFLHHLRRRVGCLLVDLSSFRFALLLQLE